MFCGLVLGQDPAPEQRWLAELLPAVATAVGGQTAEQAVTMAHGVEVGRYGADPEPVTVQDCRDALSALAASTRAALDDPEFGFDLLLPETGADLHARAVAVLDWCRGLLYGLGLTGLDPARLSPETAEAVVDLTDITRMDLDAIEEDEASDEALTEIIEYMRVSVLLLHAELSQPPARQQRVGQMPSGQDSSDPT